MGKNKNIATFYIVENRTRPDLSQRRCDGAEMAPRWRCDGAAMALL